MVPTSEDFPVFPMGFPYGFPELRKKMLGFLGILLYTPILLDSPCLNLGSLVVKAFLLLEVVEIENK